MFLILLQLVASNNISNISGASARFMTKKSNGHYLPCLKYGSPSFHWIELGYAFFLIPLTFIWIDSSEESQLV